MGWAEELELWLLRLSGLPISASPGPTTPRQIAVTASCICGYSFVVAIYVFNISQEENDNPYELYLRLHWVIYPTMAALMTLNMAWEWQSRCAPIRLSERVRYMREHMKANRLELRATNICRTVSKVLLVTTLMSICFICVKDAIDLYEIFGQFTSTSNYQQVSSLLLVLNVPSIFLLWMVLYLSAAKPLAELGFIEDVMLALPGCVPQPQEGFIEHVMPDLPGCVPQPQQGFIEHVMPDLPGPVPQPQQGFIEHVMPDLQGCVPQPQQGFIEHVMPALPGCVPQPHQGFIEHVMPDLPGPVPQPQQRFIEHVMPDLPGCVPQPQQGFIEYVMPDLPGCVPQPQQGFIEDEIAAQPRRVPERSMSGTLPSTIGDRDEEESGRSRLQSGAQKITRHRYRTLLEICRQINKLRLESNRWLHFPSCMVMFSVAWYLPILMSALGTSEGSFVYKCASWFYMAVGTLGKLAPLICAQWVKYRREVFVQKVAREIAKTSDPDLKRILTKLLLNAQDKFPDSACYLLDFDLSLFPVLLDMVVLVTTTFFK